MVSTVQARAEAFAIVGADSSTQTRLTESGMYRPGGI